MRRAAARSTQQPSHQPYRLVSEHQAEERYTPSSPTSHQRPHLLFSHEHTHGTAKTIESFLVRQKKSLALFIVAIVMMVLLLHYQGPSTIEKLLHYYWKEWVVKSIYPVPKASLPAVHQFVFPSVQERVKYYMGDFWYHGDSTKTSTTMLDGLMLCHEIPYYHVGMEEFAMHPYIQDRDSLQAIQQVTEKPFYSSNALEYYFLPAQEEQESHLRKQFNENHLRLIFMFGDSDLKRMDSVDYPMIMKARHLGGKQPPILGLLNVQRHYREVDHIRQFVPWEQKREILLFRGARTFSSYFDRFDVIQQYFHLVDDGMVDIAFSQPLDNLQNEGKNDHRSYVRESEKQPGHRRWTKARQLEYKYLLSLEGNDVSTGLKWMLYSDSVVFMAEPTVVSWAMEDKLVPYVHYIPVAADFSNLIQQVHWARQHDEECRLIAQQATQYMLDLWVSPAAQKNTRIILRKIVERYHENFGPLLSQCPKNSTASQG